MKTARYSDAQIMGILKQAEGGTPVSELCREHGMSSAIFYKWRTKFGDMDASLIAEMKDATHCCFWYTSMHATGPNEFFKALYEH